MKKQFSQSDVNRILKSRLKKSRERMTKEFEKVMKHCMASIHLTLYQEMVSLTRQATAENSEIEEFNSTQIEE